MKILYLVPDPAFFWSHRRGLAAAARDSGAEVVVATPDGPGAERFRAEGFEHRTVRITQALAPHRLALSVADVVRLYRAERPDLVHHVSMRAILAGEVAARVAGVPASVNLVTGLGWVFSSGPPLLRRLVEEAYRLCLRGRRSWTVFQNPDDRAHFLDRGLVARERSCVILGSGVDARHFESAPEPEGEPTVLLAARMIAPKGVTELIEAGRILKRRGVAHRIVLAARPDPKNPSAIHERDLRAWEAEGLASWVGHAADVRPLLEAAHVACLPSYYREGVPRFLLEAMAAGRPIVTTDMPGCRELVPDASSGLLVPPRRADALAQALEDLISDPEARAAKGRAGRALALERFSEEHVIAQTFDVYAAATRGTWR